MRRSALRIVLLAGSLAALAARGSPDGADWTVADEPQACARCHLDAAETITATGLEIRGLPVAAEAGRTYALTIRLAAPELRNAGFLLSLRTEGSDPGTLAAVDARAEVAGHQARSTWEGSFTATPGEASWQLVWTAPASQANGVRFDLWGNAGNDDLSPLGDRLLHRILRPGDPGTTP